MSSGRNTRVVLSVILTRKAQRGETTAQDIVWISGRMTAGDMTAASRSAPPRTAPPAQTRMASPLARLVFIGTRYERGFAQFDAFNFGDGRAITIAVYSSDTTP